MKRKIYEKVLLVLTCLAVSAPNTYADSSKKNPAAKEASEKKRKFKSYSFETKLSEPDKKKLTEIKEKYADNIKEVTQDIKLLREERAMFMKEKKDFIADDLKNKYQRSVKMRQLRGKLRDYRHKKNIDIVNLLSAYPEEQKKFLTFLIKRKKPSYRRRANRTQASEAW